ncbi:hypothetical protein LCGC14_1683260 [marine sediment metagenome]|uniref:Uncharacterized protein n=1 Tax=marine sediment metagenome TaxID=412755 RepID=A0A0F9HN41_9ZZZZ|nr:hypothetical protein [Candidatus Scalindua sp.]
MKGNKMKAIKIKKQHIKYLKVLIERDKDAQIAFKTASRLMKEASIDMWDFLNDHYDTRKMGTRGHLDHEKMVITDYSINRKETQ